MAKLHEPTKDEPLHQILITEPEARVLEEAGVMLFNLRRLLGNKIRWSGDAFCDEDNNIIFFNDLNTSSWDEMTKFLYFLGIDKFEVLVRSSGVTVFSSEMSGIIARAIEKEADISVPIEYEIVEDFVLRNDNESDEG